MRFRSEVASQVVVRGRVRSGFTAADDHGGRVDAHVRSAADMERLRSWITPTAGTSGAPRGVAAAAR